LQSTGKKITEGVLRAQVRNGHADVSRPSEETYSQRGIPGERELFPETPSTDHKLRRPPRATKKGNPANRRPRRKGGDNLKPLEVVRTFPHLGPGCRRTSKGEKGGTIPGHHKTSGLAVSLLWGVAGNAKRTLKGGGDKER